ncbi:MAG: methyltransferase [Spirochaetaceae bacterium]|jgi:23S rRNA (uracil1939-C5)-methyltransferase|nr:methyltransferase [Spirochaetaceae bacterium]
MLIGEIFTARVETLVAGGMGMCRLRGRTVFAPSAAPGDVIAGRIRDLRRDWALAEILEILEPSPGRTGPRCPKYGPCGGCSWQHLTYPTQLAEKRNILRDALVRIGGFSPPQEPAIHPSPPYEYRNRVQFHRSPKGGIGFKAKASGNIIPLLDCPVADPGIRQALREKRIIPPPEKNRFTVYAWRDTFLSEAGPARGKVRLLDRELLLDAGVFFQSNGPLLEQVISIVKEKAEAADAEKKAADVYCGVGTFGAFLKDRFPRLDAVEENKTALILARENVPGGEVQPWAVSADSWAKAQPDPMPYGFVIVDPPRQGLSPFVRTRLAQSGPPLLAYLSCDPASFARDAAGLVKGGYSLEDLHIFDFYPQTPHLEILGFFFSDF